MYEAPAPPAYGVVRQRDRVANLGAPLSTWGESIVAAVTGDVEKIKKLLAGEMDDGKGVDLRTFRTSMQDVYFLLDARNLVIDPNYTLIEIAVERDHFDVVNAILEPTPSKLDAEPVMAPPRVARSVSTFVPSSQADALRDFAASRLRVAPSSDAAIGGLAYFDMAPSDGRQTFFVPREVVALPLEDRRTACGLLLEDTYTMEGIDAAVGWWGKALAAATRMREDDPELEIPVVGLHALYTSGDGNCLLHAASLATIGSRDTRIALEGEPGANSFAENAELAPRRTLRAALHHSLRSCLPLRSLLAHHGAGLQGGISTTEETPPGAETLEARSRLHGNSCDPGHLLILAHVFRRPIICVAAAAVGEVRDPDVGRTFSSYAAKGERMSGVYVPCLLEPSSCSRDPITLAYTPGHFSALVSTEAAAAPELWAALGLSAPAGGNGFLGAVPVPLTDETQTPLPLLFPPPPPPSSSLSAAEHEAKLLHTYLDVHTATLQSAAGALKTLPVAAQRVPVRTGGSYMSSKALTDLFFETAWAKRLEEVRARPSEVAATSPSRPPAASRENSLSGSELARLATEPLRASEVEREDSEALLQRAIAASLLDSGRPS